MLKKNDNIGTPYNKDMSTIQEIISAQTRYQNLVK